MQRALLKDPLGSADISTFVNARFFSVLAGEPSHPLSILAIASDFPLRPDRILFSHRRLGSFKSVNPSLTSIGAVLKHGRAYRAAIKFMFRNPFTAPGSVGSVRRLW